MKLNPKFILREVAGETVLISLNDISSPKCLLCLNGTGKDIYQMLQAGRSREDILEEFIKIYPMEEAVLRRDIDEFFTMLWEKNILLEQ